MKDHERNELERELAAAQKLFGQANDAANRLGKECDALRAASAFLTKKEVYGCANGQRSRKRAEYLAGLDGVKLKVIKVQEVL